MACHKSVRSTVKVEITIRFARQQYSHLQLQSITVEVGQYCVVPFGDRGTCVWTSSPKSLHETGTGKVRQTWICIAPCREHTSKALRYGTCSQGSSQFYLHTPRLSANGMNHTCLCLPNRSSWKVRTPVRRPCWFTTRQTRFHVTLTIRCNSVGFWYFIFQLFSIQMHNKSNIIIRI